jgi:hypothetical protein
MLGQLDIPWLSGQAKITARHVGLEAARLG